MSNDTDEQHAEEECTERLMRFLDDIPRSDRIALLQDALIKCLADEHGSVRVQLTEHGLEVSK